MGLNAQLVVALSVNLALSAGAGFAAKQWAEGASTWMLALAVAINVGGFIALAVAIRFAGLGLATSIALLLTVAFNTAMGVVAFHETLSTIQFCGLGVACVAIALMVVR